jgi:hypothetical protein
MLCCMFIDLDLASVDLVLIVWIDADLWRDIDLGLSGRISLGTARIVGSVWNRPESSD